MKKPGLTIHPDGDLADSQGIYEPGKVTICHLRCIEETNP